MRGSPESSSPNPKLEMSGLSGLGLIGNTVRIVDRRAFSLETFNPSADPSQHGLQLKRTSLTIRNIDLNSLSTLLVPHKKPFGTL